MPTGAVGAPSLAVPKAGWGFGVLGRQRGVRAAPRGPALQRGEPGGGC